MTQHRGVCRRLAMAVAVATLAVTTADTDWAKAVNQNIRVRPMHNASLGWTTWWWAQKLFSSFGPPAPAPAVLRAPSPPGRPGSPWQDVPQVLSEEGKEGQ